MDVGDSVIRFYVEASVANPARYPVVVLHGGPGGVQPSRMRLLFLIPEKLPAFLFDSAGLRAINSRLRQSTKQHTWDLSR